MSDAPNAMQTHGAPSWIQHNSENPDEARRFYQEVLGWNVEDIPMKAGGTYPVIKVGDTPVGGFNPVPESEPGWLNYITVESVDDCVARAKGLSAKVLKPCDDYPGVGRIAVIQDPLGAVIALITYEQS